MKGGPGLAHTQPGPLFTIDLAFVECKREIGTTLGGKSAAGLASEEWARFTFQCTLPGWHLHALCYSCTAVHGGPAVNPNLRARTGGGAQSLHCYIIRFYYTGFLECLSLLKTYACNSNSFPLYWSHKGEVVLCLSRHIYPLVGRMRGLGTPSGVESGLSRQTAAG